MKSENKFSDTSFAYKTSRKEDARFLRSVVIMEAYRTAYVYVREEFAGVLRETDYGYSFSYDEEYLHSENPSAVSLTLPLQAEEYRSKTLFSFFDGLIPEGWLLDIVSKNWKISQKDRFGLLLVACKDPIGNVSIKEEKV